VAPRKIWEPVIDMISQFAQHFTMILTLLLSNGQVSVQTVPNFTSLATCQLAGEQIRLRYMPTDVNASFQCVLQ
jgi:hypothetical protein